MGELYNDKVHNWLNGQPDGAPPDDAELTRALEAASRLKVPAKRTQAEAWAMLEAQLEEETTEEATVVPLVGVPLIEETPQKRAYWPYMAVAAAITLVLVGYFALRSPDVSVQMAVVTTPAATMQQVNLPDASEVRLNASSTIEYAEQGWEAERAVKLEGEAFFQVAKGQTFTVQTPTGSVQVLGTAFNVYARETGFRVACEEGKVAVTSPDGQSLTLTAGQACTLQNGQLMLDNKLSATQVTAWREGKFFFHEAPYTEVFQEMARQYGVVILTEDMEDGRFTGQFTQGDLETALQVVTLPNLLSYERVGTDSVRIIR